MDEVYGPSPCAHCMGEYGEHESDCPLSDTGSENEGEGRLPTGERVMPETQEVEITEAEGRSSSSGLLAGIRPGLPEKVAALQRAYQIARDVLYMLEVNVERGHLTATKNDDLKRYVADRRKEIDAIDEYLAR